MSAWRAVGADGATPSLYCGDRFIGMYALATGWLFSIELGERQVVLAKALGHESQIEMRDAISACPDEQSALLMLHAMAAKLNASGFEFL